MEQFTIIPILVAPAILGLIISLTSSANDLKIIPTSIQLFFESTYRTILILLKSTTGDTYFFPLLYTLFLGIFISNFIGLIPYSTTASTEMVITLGLALTILGGIFIYGIILHGPLQIMHIFLPAGTPIFLLPLMIPLEILAYLTRTLSLGLRLAVNLITGHVLIKVLLSFIPSVLDNLLILSSIVLFLVLFISLEILIAYLQAYIFVFITVITIRDLQ